MDKNKYFYFDIETSGAYRSLDEMKSSNDRLYKLFLWKKSMREQTDETWKGDPADVFEKKSALLPEFGRIVCISYAFYNNKGELKIGSIMNEDEKAMMLEAKKLFDQVNKLKLTLCGYNIKGFDIPYLFKTMLKYSITPSGCLNFFNKKPWDVDIFDLQEFWKNGSNSMICTMDEMSYMIGVDSSKDEMHGYDVRDAWKEYRYKEIKMYCEKDVKCCVDMVEKLCDCL